MLASRLSCWSRALSSPHPSLSLTHLLPWFPPSLGIPSSIVAFISHHHLPELMFCVTDAALCWPSQLPRQYHPASSLVPHEPRLIMRILSYLFEKVLQLQRPSAAHHSVLHQMVSGDIFFEVSLRRRSEGTTPGVCRGMSPA